MGRVRQRVRSWLAVVGCAVLAVGGAVPAAATVDRAAPADAVNPDDYSYVALPSLFQPTQPTDTGYVLGTSGVGAIAVWDHGTVTPLRRPTPPPGTQYVSTSGAAINASGTVASTSEYDSSVAVGETWGPSDYGSAPQTFSVGKGNGSVYLPEVHFENSFGELAVDARVNTSSAPDPQIMNAGGADPRTVPTIKVFTTLGSQTFTGESAAGAYYIGDIGSLALVPLDFMPLAESDNGWIVGQRQSGGSSVVVQRSPQGMQSTVPGGFTPSNATSIPWFGMSVDDNGDVMGPTSSGVYQLLLHGDTTATPVKALLPENVTDTVSSAMLSDGGTIAGYLYNGTAGGFHGFLLQHNAGQLSIGGLTLDPVHPTVNTASVTATLTVRNDYSKAVTAVVPGLTSSDPTALAITGGPSPARTASLASGASTTFTYTLKPKKAATVTLQPSASATTSTGAHVDAPAVAPLTVDLSPGDLAIALAADPAQPVAGHPVKITATITNRTADTLTNLAPTLTSTPSSHVTVSAATPARLASLDPHATTTVTWTLTAADPGTYQLDAAVRVTDPSSGTETDHGTLALTAATSAIVVTTTGDQAEPAAARDADTCDVDPNTDGDQCTLRAAIQLANHRADTEKITFDIPGSGTPVISPDSALPTATAPLVIDGTTQTGKWVTLSGARAGAATDGLILAGDHSTVRGLQLVSWTGAAIHVDGAGTTIAGNRVGTVDGVNAAANYIGVEIEAPNVTIGGSMGTSSTACTGDCNLISGNRDGSASGTSVIGILACGRANNASVVGDWIGVTATGSSALRNDVGLLVESSHASCSSAPSSALPTGVHVGGPTGRTGVAPGNLISGNERGVVVNSGGSGDVIAGNLIGTNAAGTAAVTASNTVEPDGVSAGILTVLPLLGGSGPADRNVISGQSPDASLARFKREIENDEQRPGAGVRGAMKVVGNYIGTDITGTRAIPNDIGVVTDRTRLDDNRLLAEVRDNLVSGNGWGISDDSGSIIDHVDTVQSYSAITGNRIGTNVDGTAALPNLEGIITASAVGGIRPVGDTHCDRVCNLISGNRGTGVVAGSVKGNFVGTDITGTKAIPNNSGQSAVLAGNALSVDAVVTSTAGGPSNATNGVCDQACNLISGNRGYALLGATGHGTSVAQGNLIGVSVTGSGLGNDAGIAQVATVGGDGTGEGNVIADNIHDAIVNNTGVQSDSEVPLLDSLLVLGNQIFGNGGGIAYGNAALAGFDFPEHSDGFGGEPWVPRIDSATTGTSGLTITGVRPGYGNTGPNITPASSYRIDVYAGADCSRAAQGAIPLGHHTYAATEDQFALTLPTALPSGYDDVTITVTMGGNTSLFAGCGIVTGLPAATLSVTTATAGQPVTVTGYGFAAGEGVQASLHTTPIDLGTHTASSAGVVQFTFVIPKDLPAGVHHVTLTGLTSNRTATIPLTVLAAAGTTTSTSPNLADTGAGDIPLDLAAALLLFTAGTTLLLAARRRRTSR